MDASLTDEEKRFLLGEMIKASKLDVNALVSFLKERCHEPDWMQMQLPTGRNLNQCIMAAEEMFQIQFTITTPTIKRRLTPTEASGSEPASKRPALAGSAGAVATTGFATGPMLSPIPPPAGYYPSSPLSHSAGPGAAPQSFPPPAPHVPILPRPSSRAAAAAAQPPYGAMISPGAGAAHGPQAQLPTAPRKRGRPPRTSKSLARMMGPTYAPLAPHPPPAAPTAHLPPGPVMQSAAAGSGPPPLQPQSAARTPLLSPMPPTPRTILPALVPHGQQQPTGLDQSPGTPPPYSSSAYSVFPVNPQDGPPQRKRGRPTAAAAAATAAAALAAAAEATVGDTARPLTKSEWEEQRVMAEEERVEFAPSSMGHLPGQWRQQGPPPLSPRAQRQEEPEAPPVSASAAADTDPRSRGGVEVEERSEDVARVLREGAAAATTTTTTTNQS